MKRTLIALTILACGCSGSPTQPHKTTTTEPSFEPEIRATAKVPKRIILLIGDGMGMPQVTAGAYANDGPLNMMTMPYFSWMTVHEYEFATTDSAASATAMATGFKTHYTGVGVKPGTTAQNESDPSTHLKSVMEWAQELKLGTGMVATTRIVHATPAAFGAHRAGRKNYDGIALDLANGEFDVLMGAGRKYFRERDDKRDLLQEMASRGYDVVNDAAKLDEATGNKLVALFHDGDMPYIADGGRGMELKDMLKTSVSRLDHTHPNGWVLLVEGSFIDWCAHDLNGPCLLKELADFDATVGEALSYARGRDDTLVVATADHETGGLAVVDPYYTERFSTILGGEAAMQEATALQKDGDSPAPVVHFKVGDTSGTPRPAAALSAPKWNMPELKDARFTMTWGHMSIASRPLFTADRRYYGAHTVTMVPIFAEGPGADFVTTASDNADLGQNLIELVKSRRNNSPTFVAANDEDVRPKNVVLLIGDGMGIAAVSSSTYLNADTTMAGFPVHGYASTHGINALVNDSAAAATALATGKRTRKRTVGMVVEDAVLVPGVSVIDKAEKLGLSTGIVTTTQLTHATPAAFYADVDHRRKKWEIAKQFVSFKRRTPASDGIDVVVAGGAADFDDTMRASLKADGYDFRTTWDPRSTPKNVVMLMAKQGLDHAAARRKTGATLGKMTDFALAQLSAKQDDGFFLVIEGGQIDWELHHGKRDMSVPDEVQDFDTAVAAAKAFAQARGDTLVIVTADHDHTLSVLDNHYAIADGMCSILNRCGGPFAATWLPVAKSGIHNGDGFSDTKLQGKFAPPELLLQYAWMVQEGLSKSDLDAPHAANFVPVFAYGPWATRLRGLNDQPEIGQLLHAWANSIEPAANQ